MTEPTHIYKVVVNVISDGSCQHNIFKSRVDSFTQKHFILKKNYWRTRAEHVDRSLIGGHPDCSVSIGFAKGSAWCLEEDVNSTIEIIREKLQEGLKEAEARLSAMSGTLMNGTPQVTRRDTNEFG